MINKYCFIGFPLNHAVTSLTAVCHPWHAPNHPWGAKTLHLVFIELLALPYLLPEGEGKINSHEDQRNSAGLEDDSRGACSFFIVRNYEGVAIELPRLLCVRHRAPRRRHDAAAGQRL